MDITTTNTQNDQQFYNDAVRAVIIKWAVIGGLFAVLLAWIVIGHVHARRRVRKGRPLLAYHRVCSFVCWSRICILLILYPVFDIFFGRAIALCGKLLYSSTR